MKCKGLLHFAVLHLIFCGFIPFLLLIARMVEVFHFDPMHLSHKNIC